MTDTPKIQLDVSHFTIHIQDYHTHVYFKNIHFQKILFKIFSEQNPNPSPRKGPQDLLVTH